MPSFLASRPAALLRRAAAQLVLVTLPAAPAGVPAQQAGAAPLRAGSEAPQAAPAASNQDEADRQAHEAALRVIQRSVRLLLDSGALEQAASELARLLQRAPRSPEVHLLAAEVYYRLGADERVEHHAAAARSLDPASPLPDRWLARLARWRGRLREARRHLRAALERHPGSAQLNAELGALLEAEGHRRRAQRFLRRAAALEPEDPASALDVALALRAPEERDAALSRLVERHPNYAAGRAWATLCGAAGGKRLWEVEPWVGPVEIPVEVEQRHFLLVEADLGDGQATRLLLDTGSTGLKITRRLARRLELTAFGSLQVSGLGSGRLAAAELVLIDRLRLGELSLRRVPATALEQLPFGDGLLNPMALGAEAARLDMSQRLLVLDDNERLMPEEARALPFIEYDEQPLVRLFLNGQPRLAMIDSGSGATVLDESVIRQIPERRPMLIEGLEFSLSGVLGEVKEARPVHVSRLRLGPVEIENPVLFEADLSRFGEHLGTDVRILFGADFLSRFSATFDYRRMELTLEPAGKRRRRALR